MIQSLSPRYLQRISRLLASVFLPLAICIFALSLSTAIAQESSQSSSSQNSSATAAQTQSGDAQLAQQSNEAAGKKAEGEDDEAQFKHSPSVQYLAKKTGMSLEHAYWLGVMVNFAIVAGIILWLSGKHLPILFRNRTASIQKAMEEARRASEDANRRLAEIESRLSKLDREIAGMMANAEKEAAAEEARIKAAAEEDAQRIIESAEQEISAAAKSAKRELTAYAADLAVSLAKKQIHVDDPTDQALVRDFAQQLTGRNRQ